MTLELLAAARALASADRRAGRRRSCSARAARRTRRRSARPIGSSWSTIRSWPPIRRNPIVAALQEVIAAEQPRAVLIGATSIGWDLAPLLAARLDAPLVTGCKEIKADGDALRVTASFCGGKMMAECRVAAAPAILMVLPGSFRPAERAGKGRSRARAASPRRWSRGRFASSSGSCPRPATSTSPSRTSWWPSAAGFSRRTTWSWPKKLAQALGGAVCASRPVVDQGWLPATRQVGKSGMTVKPKLYLALGISGAPEHQEGMKGADLIIAVNTDPKAPIFDIAHYGAEVDVLDLLPALTEAIEARKG